MVYSKKGPTVVDKRMTRASCTAVTTLVMVGELVTWRFTSNGVEHVLRGTFRALGLFLPPASTIISRARREVPGAEERGKEWLELSIGSTQSVRHLAHDWPAGTWGKPALQTFENLSLTRI